MSSRRTADGGLRRLGWAPATGGTTGAVELAAGEDWLVARLRTGPFVAGATDLGVSTCRVIVGVAGQIDVGAGGLSFPLRGKDVVIVNGDQPLSIRSEEGWKGWEWQLTSPPSGLVRARVIKPTPFVVDSSVHRLMESMTSSLISVAPAEGSRAQVFIYRALSQIVVAAVADSLRLGSTRQRLFERAQLVIEESYTDPGFSVDALGQALSVSRSYLYEVFTEFGTSPRREIERRRVVSVLARFDLETLSVPTLSPEIVGVSGFSSAKRLRQALARHHADLPAP